MYKYICNLIHVVLLILIPSLIFSWWAGGLTVDGDLTRIGKWTEHDFGPNIIHPSAPINENSKFQQSIDILVLGDSFSVGNVWQSVLADKTGYNILSFHYESNCIANWIETAVAESSSKFIVIETVERSLIERFGNISKCSSKTTIPIKIQTSVKPSYQTTSLPTLNLTYLLPTALNTLELNISPEEYFNRFLVVNVPLKLGCSKFSNRRNNRLLYYAEDDLKQQWSFEEVSAAIKNILEIQEQVERHGKKLIFMVAPDKSSVYQSCFLNQEANKNEKNINSIMILSGVNAPDMETLFKSNISIINDLYLPDGTHWSIAGYKLAGDAMSRYIASMNMRN
jgi:hypothetical protein